MNTKMLSAFLIGIILLPAIVTACASPSTQVPATPTFLALPTSTLFLGTPPTAAQPGGTPLPGTIVAYPNPATICGDPQVTAMIDSFKKAILTSDGPLLSTLVSPPRGAWMLHCSAMGPSSPMSPNMPNSSLKRPSKSIGVRSRAAEP